MTSNDSLKKAIEQKKKAIGSIAKKMVLSLFRVHTEKRE